jgi:hypothetical protein
MPAKLKIPPAGFYYRKCCAGRRIFISGRCQSTRGSFQSGSVFHGETFFVRSAGTTRTAHFRAARHKQARV